MTYESRRFKFESARARDEAEQVHSSVRLIVLDLLGGDQVVLDLFDFLGR